MQYSNLTTALGELLVVTITDPASAAPSNDTSFNNILPSIINDAEQRIYRELDFLATRNTVYEANALANQRVMFIPSTTIVLQGANIITNPNVMSQSPGNNAGDLFYETFGSPNNQISIQDEYSNTANITVGQFINILTLLSTSADFPTPFIQGPYPITSISANTPGVVLQYLINLPTASTQGTIVANSPGMSFSTVSGSNIVTTNLPLHGLSVGSIITVGINTLLGTSTTIAAGDYTVVSIVDANNFTLNLPTSARDTAGPTFENQGAIVLQYLNNPVTGTKNRLEFVSKDALDILWPTDLSEQDVPRYAAFIDNQTMALGPVPDQSYIVEFTGTFRPAPMSASNTTTYLGTTYPDLFLAACMVFGMLYQKDADQPQGASPGQDMQKWEQVYKERKVSALSEIQRQKGQGTNWSQYSPTPESSPPRP